MEAIAAIVGTGGQGARPGGGRPAPMNTAVQSAAAAPIASTQMGGMQPTETKDSFGGAPRYQRSGFSAGLDTAAQWGKWMQNPAQQLVERMAGDPKEMGTFAQEHPETMQIVKGLFD